MISPYTTFDNSSNKHSEEDVTQARVERRLAAILAADVVGYSRLMGADEAGTLARLQALRAEAVDPAIAEHNGRMVKLMGDGALVEFGSVVDAVACAVAVQNAVAEAGGELSADQRIVFRIGVNLGDVIVEGDDIYGDGVNVASRLQEIAEPGGVCISGSVFEQIKGKLDAAFDDMGAQDVKNIAEPVRAYRWAGCLTAPPVAASLALPDKPSIAVLPFDNMSDDPAQEFFADGIAEDIIAALSRFHWFFVISRNSSFTYKGKAVDVKQAARELGVQYVLEGSVRKAGERVRITAQLIDAVGDHHVWAERYDRVLEDIFAVQDEITQSIVGTVAPEFLDAEMQRARRKEVPRLDAWELVTRAHWHVTQFSKEDNVEARSLLLKAVELDPETSFGLADLSFTYLRDWVYGLSDDQEHAMAKAIGIAERAVAINPRDAYAHALLGAAALYSGRHDDAVPHLEQAITLNPNAPHAYSILGRTQIYLGESERGLENVNRAIRLSPRDPMITLWFGIQSVAAFMDERYDDALDWAKSAIRAQPQRNTAYLDLAAACARLGKAEEAAEAVATFERLTVNPSLDQAARIHPFTRAVDRERYLGALRKAGLAE